MNWNDKILSWYNIIPQYPLISFKSELLPALIEWQRGKGQTTFNCQVSINLADDEQLMRMMIDTGFDIVLLELRRRMKTL